MDVTRDVIIDLLPLYQSGEASADTRRLVEHFVAGDPALARLARGAAEGPLGERQTPTLPPSETDRRASLEHARRLIARRQVFLAGAILLTLFPLSFAFAGGDVVWLMYRDEPALAAGCLAGGVICWINYLRIRKNLSVTGL